MFFRIHPFLRYFLASTVVWAIVLTATVGLASRMLLTNFSSETRYSGTHSEFEVLRIASIFNDFRYKYDEKEKQDFRVFLVGSSASRDSFDTGRLKEYLAQKFSSQNISVTRLTMDNAGALGETLLVFNTVKYLHPDLVVWSMMPSSQGAEQYTKNQVLEHFSSAEFMYWMPEFSLAETSLSTRLRQRVQYFLNLETVWKVILMKLTGEEGKTYREVLKNYTARRTMSEKKMAEWFYAGNRTREYTDNNRPDGIGTRIYLRALKFMDENKIPTLIYNIPVTKYFNLHYPAGTVESFKSKIRKFTEKSPGLKFVETPNTMPVDLFYDPAHMNKSGRAEFMKYFTETLDRTNALDIIPAN